MAQRFLLSVSLWKKKRREPMLPPFYSGTEPGALVRDYFGGGGKVDEW